MSERQIIGVSPRMENSAGHDKLMYLLLSGFEQMQLGIDEIELKPQAGDPSSYLEQKLWRRVEAGKQSISEAHAAGKRRTGWLNILGDALRGNGLVNGRLLTTYSQKLDRFSGSGSYYTVVSSHYLAGIDREFPKGWKNIMVPPDNKPQAPVAKYPGREDTSIWAVNGHVRDAVIGMGVSEEQVVDTGLLVPDKVYNAIKERLDKQDALDTGEGKVKDHVLVTIGASGPEIPQALRAIEEMVNRGIDLTIHCGDDRPIAINFREQVEAIIQKCALVHDLKSQINITGGRKGITREIDLKLWFNHLCNPDITTSLTRPNEMLNIAPALGMNVLLLDPFQFHEEHSYRLIIDQTNNSNVIPYSGNFQFPMGTSYNFESGQFWIEPTTTKALRDNPRAMKSLGISEV